MNLPAISKISLYRLTQEGELASSPTQISPPILKMMVGALVDFWLEQEVNTQLWLKLPPTYSWQTEIEAYQSQGKLQQLFYCDSGANNPLVSTENQVSPNGKIIPVQLQSNYWLGKEFFLIFLSPSLCSMILAQWQSPKSDKANSPYLKTVITFQPKVIARVLAGIKIASLRPSTQFLQTNQFSLPEKVNATAKVWEQLLLKQLQRTEGMFQSQIFGELNSTISNLKETLSLKEELLCSLVRELRPPITTMKTALSLLQSNQLKKLQRERYLSLIERECQKQNDLIFALVELININQTANSDTQPYVKIEDLIPGIVSTYQPLAQEQGIQLGYTISPNLPLAACSSNSLKQIMINLLNNSLKFTLPQGKIKVQVYCQQKKYINLEVIDSGIGIESADLPNIFNSFYRGKNNLKSTDFSVGLGLTIVKQLVQKCSGSISVNSQVNRGTRVKILLPIVLNIS